MARSWDESKWPKQVKRTEPEMLYRVRNILPRPEPWMDRGACVGRAPQWDRTVDGETEKARLDRQREAGRICRQACPVLRECRDWADRTKDLLDFGVCAGRIPKPVSRRSTARVWAELG